MQNIIYFDNSATTKPCKTSIEYTNNCLAENWGNPSSLHNLGFEAELTLNDARKEIAAHLKCLPVEIYFTGSGTEANNLALFGTANALKKRGKRIVSTTIEHPSVLNSLKVLEEQGFDVVLLKPNSDGFILTEDIYKAINSDTILVSMMLINNETGCIMPVNTIKDAIKKVNSPALVHCDCVQAFGKTDINPKALGADLISISGHKIHGPKGIGALYKAKNINIKPIIHGGNQEGGLRSGTEPLPMIAGFMGACKEVDIKNAFEKLSALNIYARQKLSNIKDVTINSPQRNCSPYILNISVQGIRSETLLHFLESKNIFVSSGSACSKGKGSYVLNEMGLDKNLVDSALRLSFCKDNTIEEIDIFCEQLEIAIAKLVHKRH